jgi:hypothetical protein
MNDIGCFDQRTEPFSQILEFAVVDVAYYADKLLAPQRKLMKLDGMSRLKRARGR